VTTTERIAIATYLKKELTEDNKIDLLFFASHSITVMAFYIWAVNLFISQLSK